MVPSAAIVSPNPQITKNLNINSFNMMGPLQKSFTIYWKRDYVNLNWLSCLFCCVAKNKPSSWCSSRHSPAEGASSFSPLLDIRYSIFNTCLLLWVYAYRFHYKTISCIDSFLYVFIDFILKLMYFMLLYHAPLELYLILLHFNYYIVFWSSSALLQNMLKYFYKYIQQH